MIMTDVSTNLEVYEKVREVPKEALKPILGGRLKGMSDINPMWRIKMLTETFGICGIGWKTEITDKRLERGSGEEVVCFVDINLYIKVDGVWSDPIIGMGGSSFTTAERNGVYTSDECFKMAYTDAISVACKSLGFAADVYYANDRTKYTKEEEQPSQPQQTAQKQPEQAQQPKKYDITVKQPEPQKQAYTTSGDGRPTISEKQIKYLESQRDRKKIPAERFNSMLVRQGVTTIEALNTLKMNAVLAEIQSYLPVPTNSNDDLPF